MEQTATASEWDEPTFEQVLERLRSEGTIYATDVRISRDRLDAIMEAAPEVPNRPGRRLLKNAVFSRVTFEGNASFDNTTFEGGAVFEGATFEGEAGFERAAFTGGDACFKAAVFQRDAWFTGGFFGADGVFERATFKGDARFEGTVRVQGDVKANFVGRARFREATFCRWARFVGATFLTDAVFDRSTFEDKVFFAAPVWGDPFQGYAGFQEATFRDDVFFNCATFMGDASFSGATFGGPVWFGEADFLGEADFVGASFEGARDFGPVLARKSLTLRSTVFAQPIRIEMSGRALSCARAQFRRGADLLVRWAEVALDGADFAESSMIGPGPDPVPGEDRALDEFSTVGEVHNSGREPAPRVVSVRGAKLANLTIADADMRPCRFGGAFGLDQLRLESVRFAETPRGWQWTRRWPLPIRWTRRQVIAEEHHWRAQEAGATGWYGPEVRKGFTWPRADRSVDADPSWGTLPPSERVALEAVAAEDVPEQLAPRAGRARPHPPQGPGIEDSELAPQAPEQIAAIYRALRKGREDRKDEPGAADFYYGEMEMRRQRPHVGAAALASDLRAVGLQSSDEAETTFHGQAAVDVGVRTASRAERLLLWFYWLVSGYALRASRALLALALTVVVCAFVFDWWGFRPDRPFGRTLLFSIESTSGLFRVPDTPGSSLTAAGEAVQVLLRLLGPLFFGLALLSLRGRVKR